MRAARLARRVRQASSGSGSLVKLTSSAAAGSGAGTSQGDAANALIKFLHTPEAAAVFKARGLKPEGAAKAS